MMSARLNWSQLADFAALNKMAPAHAVVSGTYEEENGETRAHINLTNNSNHIAFFLHAEISTDPDGNEVLPIRYDDNYITVFPHDSRTIEAVFRTSLLSGHKPVVRTEGYDVAKQIALLVSSKRK